MKIEYICHKVGQSIVDSIEEDWNEALLNVQYTGDSAEFHLNYLVLNKNSNYSGIDYSVYEAAEKLHKITTERGHNKWNRLKYKLTPDGEMDLKFIWDQELFNEIEHLSKE